MTQSADQFNTATKIIHWLSALVIFGLLAVGFIMEGMPRGPEKFELIGLHKSIGVLALLLIIIRIPVRIMNPVGPLPGTPRQDVIKAKALQGLLYLMMLVMPKKLKKLEKLEKRQRELRKLEKRPKVLGKLVKLWKELARQQCFWVGIKKEKRGGVKKRADEENREDVENRDDAEKVSAAAAYFQV